mmetsp:Transcript_23550/g.52139  ORF Transcript_23550/g.52139 Transcript_23550/m.52139 type:complete len:1106 (-) Transcript_23550:95-3412(-)
MALSGEHDRWLVYTSRSAFVIADHPEWPVPAGRQQQAHSLTIARETGVAQEVCEKPEDLRNRLALLGGSGKAPAPWPCVAVLGLLCVDSASFLLVVTHAAVAAGIDGHKVLEIKNCQAVPLAARRPAGEEPAEVARVRQILEKNFYLSHDFDITRRLQRRMPEAGSPSAPARAEDLMATADGRFVWNRQLVEPLTRHGVSTRWFTPVMQGFFQAREAQPRPGLGPSVALLLVARRSCLRAGTRYNARGLNSEGEAANFVETEQLLYMQGEWLSLVQVRGSAPVLWEQSARTAVSVTCGPELVAIAFEKHLRRLEAEYGEMVFLSLLSQSGMKHATEGVLAAALAEQASRHKKLKLLQLDFHARLGEGGNFDDNLEAMGNKLFGSIESLGYLHTSNTAGASSSGEGFRHVRRKQTGALRVNCFDCLDRSNIVQYQLTWQWLRSCLAGRSELRHLLQAAPVVPPPGGLGGLLAQVLPPSTSRPRLQEVLREMWADLGDVLSEFYTGTASTMGAALRQGRNVLSVMEQGWRTANRAYVAAFEDTARQEALQLLLDRQDSSSSAPRAEARREPRGKLIVSVVTWNLHGDAIWRDASVLQRLVRASCTPASPKGPVDLVCFCFQEFMQLTTSNVVMQDAGNEMLQAEFDRCALQALAAVLGEPFIQVQSVGMVGLLVSVYLAKRLQRSVAAVGSERIRSGLMGQMGNKGAVAVRLQLEETTICAVSCHLESGQGKAEERAGQLQEVLHSRVGKGPVVSKHDFVVLGGDFNFRLAMPEIENTEAFRASLATAWPKVAPDKLCGVGEGALEMPTGQGVMNAAFSRYEELQGHQSSAAREALRAAGLVEGPVLFPPTYRLRKGATAYDPERVPAWCDRVLHSKVDVVRRRYCSLGSFVQSDHRPVSALMETSLLAKPQSSADKSSAHKSSASNPTSPVQKVQTAQTVQMDLLGEGWGQGQPTPAVAAAASAPATKEIDLLSPKQQAAKPRQADLLGDLAQVFSPPTRGSQGAGPPASQPLPTAAPLREISPPSSLAAGQLVLAEHDGGWFYAHVLRVRGGRYDVAWLRPRADRWGEDSTNERYLCSTGADETLHGDGLPATRIRRPEVPESKR